MAHVGTGVAGVALLLIISAVLLIHAALRRENERLRWCHRALNGAGAASRPRREIWLVRAIAAGVVIPCAALLVLSAYSGRLDAQDAAPGSTRSGSESLLIDGDPAVVQAEEEPGELAAADCQPIAPSQLRPYLEGVAARERVPVELLRAVIYSESRFRPCAVSRTGAVGMMQLMPGTAAELGVRDVRDPAENIIAGARLLKRLLARYDGDLSLTLAAYHAGPGRVDAHAGIPPIRETRAYVSEVLWVLGIEPDEARTAD